MSSPSDMSDDHSQPSDEDDHQTDSDSQSSQRADVEEFFDNSAQEQSGSEVSSRASDVDEEGRDEQFDGLSDSGSDLDANIENMNRHQRRRLLDSGGLPGGPNGMFGRRSILDDMAEEDFFAEHGSEASDDTDLDQMWGFDRSGKHRPRDKTQYTFTQFKRLPLELRERIWESFCPDLAVKGRFYEFKLISSSRDYRYGPAAAPEVWEGAVLAQQTETARRVLSVHKESRNFALRSFPHELHLRAGRGIVRFHSHRDVIYIEKASRFDVQNHIPMPVLPNFSDRVRHVGLDPDLWYYLDPALEGFLTAFPNLQHAYFVTEYSWPRPKDMLWCADGQNVNHYYLDSYEVTMGIAADVTYRWAWPNLTTQAGKEFAEKFIDPVKIGKDDNRGNYAKKAWDAGLEVWPLVGFPQDHGDWAFQKLLDWAKKGETDVKWPDEDDEDDDDESSEEADEYESSGIDDGSLAESEEESEDDLAVVDGSDTDRDDDDSDEDGLEAPALMHGEEFAGFSSPEPESGDETSSSATVREASDHDSASEHPSSPPPKSKLKRPRGRVLDSDDEEEEDISHKRARTDATTRRMRPSTSDSEDSHQNQEEKEDDSENEDSAPQFRRAKESSRRRRKRRSISDSDDDDDNADDTDSEDASPQVAPKRKRARTSTKLIVESDDDSSEEERKMRKNALLVHPEIEEDEEESGSDGHSRSESDQEDSDEDDSEDEDEDDDKPSRPLTLAEKLALHREKYPIPSDDDGDEEAKDTDEDGGVNVDAEPMGGTDYDARDYADFQDDEEGYEHEIEEEERADRNDAQYFDDSVEYDDNDGEGEW